MRAGASSSRRSSSPRRNAVRPSRAHWTLWPARRSLLSTASPRSRLSSTSRMRMSFLQLMIVLCRGRQAAGPRQRSASRGFWEEVYRQRGGCGQSGAVPPERDGGRGQLAVPPGRRAPAGRDSGSPVRARARPCRGCRSPRRCRVPARACRPRGDQRRVAEAHQIVAQHMGHGAGDVVLLEPAQAPVALHRALEFGPGRVLRVEGADDGEQVGVAREGRDQARRHAVLDRRDQLPLVDQVHVAAQR